MSDNTTLFDLAPGTSRRRLLTNAGLAAGAAALGSGLIGGITPMARGSQNLVATYGTRPNRITVNDTDILTFALNTEYLAAEYYGRAVNGTGLVDSSTTGVIGYGKKPYTATAAGGVTAPSGTAANGGVAFAYPVIQQFATQVANNEIAHVNGLRAALGSKAPARPTIDITNAFTNAAIAAGIITAGQTFNPYLNDETFMVGAFLLNDVDISAYVGGSPYISSPTVLATAAAILGAEAYHAGGFRQILYSMGQDSRFAYVLDYCNRISVLRNTATALIQGPGTYDEGLSNNTGGPNLVSADENSVAFARTFADVLNVVYLGTTATPTPGGFFPSGFNGRIR